ncbi:hypothetical protein V2I01_08830 [Micromonospora sp. BRA006-A]|nr:hypothetical protein [Micromonospora sp. BRA006-A]
MPIPASPTTRAADVSELPRTRRAERRGGRFWQTLVGGAAVLLLPRSPGSPSRPCSTNAPPHPRPASRPAADRVQHPVRRHRPGLPGHRPGVTHRQGGLPGKGSGGHRRKKPAYRVLKTQASTKCQVAATGEIADLLVRLGCNQVVRARSAPRRRPPDHRRSVQPHRRGHRPARTRPHPAAARRAPGTVPWHGGRRRHRGGGEGRGPGRLAGTRTLRRLLPGHPRRRGTHPERRRDRPRDHVRHGRAAPQPGWLDRRAAAGTAGQPDAESAGDSAGQRGTD